MFSFLPWVSENVPEWKSHDMLYTNTWVGWVCGAFCWSRWTQNICLVWTVLMCVEILVRAFYLLSYKFNTKLETWLCHGMFIIARLLKVIVHGWEEMKWQSHVPYCVRNTDLTLPATAWSMNRSLLFLLFSTSLLISTFPVSQIYLYTKLPQLNQVSSPAHSVQVFVGNCLPSTSPRAFPVLILALTEVLHMTSPGIELYHRADSGLLVPDTSVTYCTPSPL